MRTQATEQNNTYCHLSSSLSFILFLAVALVYGLYFSSSPSFSWFLAMTCSTCFM